MRALVRKGLVAIVIALSEKVEEVIELMFPQDIAPLVREHLLYECAENVPFCTDYSPCQMDRIRLSALRLSNGDYCELKKAVLLAQKDWRDLFMAAGFGHDPQAHLAWKPDVH
jgi:hypothetical protein